MQSAEVQFFDGIRLLRTVPSLYPTAFLHLEAAAQARRILAYT